MIQYIFIDLDDTLLDFHRAEAIAVHKTLYTLTGTDYGEEVLELYSEINRNKWKQLEQGSVTREELKQSRFVELFAALGIHASAALAKNIYEKNLSSGHYFIEGAPKLLIDLFRKYELYIVSNGTSSVQNSRIASAGIARYFKGIFLSEEMGANKPDKAFFDACFATIPNFDPQRAILLGDSLSSDIQGGINAGIRTCWFDPHGVGVSEGILPDHRITSLSDFPPLLRLLEVK